MKKNTSPLHFWSITILLLGLILLAGPSYYFFASVMESGNEVQITATVPNASETGTSSSSSSNSSSGGAGTWFSNLLEEEEGQSSIDTQIGGTQIAVNTEPEEENIQADTLTIESSIEAPAQTVVHFGGFTFPMAQVTFNINGEEVRTVQADSTGYFEGSYGNVFMGENVFTFVAESYEGEKSKLVSYSYEVKTESPVFIPYILLPPLVYVTGLGTVEGLSIPGATVEVYGVSTSDQSLVILETIQVDEDGNFELDFDLGEEIPYEQFYLSCELEGSTCGYSQVLQVQTVGETSRFIEDIFADFTQDVQVNFIDFAFMRDAFLNGSANLFYDLNQDGELNLEDFSLLNYQWTL